MARTSEDPPANDRAERLRDAIRKKKAARDASRPGSERAAQEPRIPPRPERVPARLGPMQRSLWLAHRLDPTSAADHLVDAYRLSGQVDSARLRSAFRQVVRRHRLLRSSFRSTGTGVVQDILPAEAVEATFDLEVVPAPQDDPMVVAAREAQRPFDLSTPPLVRMVLVQQLDRPVILMLVLHHLLADEQALGVFWREMSGALRDDLDEAAPAGQYDDVVHWLGRREPDGQELDAWRRRLDPAPPELALPFQAMPAAERRGRPGRLVARPLPADLAAGVRELAQRAGATPFFVLAFAYGLFLRRLTEGPPPAFASPVSTRLRAGTADMIGYFTNPVVMPTLVDESMDVASALRAFRSEALERMAQATIPFQDLVEALDPPRSAGRHPIFQTMFVLRRPGAMPELGPDIAVERLQLDLGVAKFDLTLFVTEGDRPELELAAEYRIGRFDDEGVRRLLALYETLLCHLVAADLETPVRDVSMLDADEAGRLQTLSQGHQLTRALDRLPQRTAAVAATSPDAPALVFEGRATTYAELDEMANRLAARLESVAAADPAHLNGGVHVGLFLPRAPAAIVAIVAIHRAGAGYVPLDPAYPAERNRLILDDAAVVAVVTTRELADRLPEGPWRVLLIDGAPDASTDSSTKAAPEPGVRADDAAYLLYTSGSTGRPKGVVVTHGNLRASTAARLQAYGDLGVRPGRFLLLPSLAFDSSVAGLFWCQAVGDALVLPTDDAARDPRELASIIERDRVTTLLCVPSLYAQILRALPPRTAAGLDAPGGLEAVIVAGEACSWSLVREHFERLPDVRLFNEYGPTEATVWATLHELRAGDVERLGDSEPVSIGRPIPGVRIDLEDAAGRAVPVGVPGQAWIAGETVTAGYRGRADLTAARFGVGPDGVRRYRTGDRMAWTDDGRLLFLGREDEQVKLRGFRIEPGEIESALVEAGAKRAAVIVRRPQPDQPPSTERLVAFVEGEARGWRSHLESKLPPHMVPSRVIALDALPLLPNGKLDRGRLQAISLPETSEPAKGHGVREVPSTLELSLLSLWQGLLGMDDVGLDDNFFEMGGHSLQVAEMTLAIERDIGGRLSAADVFQHPTVRRLARRLTLGGDVEAPYEHLFPIQPSGDGAPFLFCVPHFFSSTFAERFRGERPVYGLRGVSLRQEGNLGRWPSMRHLADELVREVKRRFPESPDGGFLVAGYSFGGSMAVEMVRAMEECGLAVRRLYLITPMPLDFADAGPLRLQLRPLRQPTRELTSRQALRIWVRDHDPRTLRPYRSIGRWLKVKPARHALARLGQLQRRLGVSVSPAVHHRILHADVRVERFRLHRSYRPMAVATPTTIFNAEDNAETPGTDTAATWRPIFRDLEVVPTPDPHRDAEAVAAAKRVILDHLRGAT